MIWHKYVTPAGEYYSPFSRSKSKLRVFSSPQEMAEEINKSTINYTVITDSLVEVYDKLKPETDPLDLPFGVYSYEGATNSNPERLTPMNLRDDGYTNILQSLENLDETINQFRNNKELYEDSKSIYKLGILLFGPPGTGKTSYIRQFIKSQKNSVIVFLDSIPTRKFIEKLEESTKNVLKILVFEEAVSLLEHSEDIREMLDFLDGSKSLSNAIYFMSTNYPEAIPENVVRNGRIDIFVKVDYPKEDARGKLINLYLKRKATDKEISLTENMPIVDIREICFLHKKENKSFEECVKMIEEKNKMLKKHFGKTKEIRLA